MNERDYLDASRQFLSGGFHTDNVYAAEVHYMMNAAEVATKWCDAVKRGLFYGTKIKQRHGADSTTSLKLKPELASLIHGIIGAFGEAGEMLEHLHEVLSDEAELDKVNLLEELGDIEWYLARIHDFINSTPSQAWQTNIAKLDKRYPGRVFTRDSAENRDLEGERAVLEHGTAPAEALPPPAPGSVWVHRSGTEYHVLHLANEPNDDRYPLTVVYQGPNGKVWSRRADDWHRSMTAKTMLRKAAHAVTEAAKHSPLPPARGVAAPLHDKIDAPPGKPSYKV